MRKIIFACLAALSFAAPATAQNAELDRVFDNTVTALTQYMTSSKTGKYADGYHKIYYFLIPKTANKDVENLNSSITKASINALSSMMKKAGSNDKSTLTVMYGDKDRGRLAFGKSAAKNCNVVIIADSVNKDMRYAYALEWQNINDSLSVAAYNVYGKTAKVTPKTFSSENYLTDEERAKMNNDVFFTQVPKSSSDFVKLLRGYSNGFKTFETLYLDNKDVNKKYGVTWNTAETSATKIYNLCKEYGKILDKSDRSFVESRLLNLRDSCKDEFKEMETYFINAYKLIHK